MPIGRPRDFHEDEVVDKAVELFWRRGYEPTSLNDLLGQMQISRQSLYNTFGSKDKLFERVLDRYIEVELCPIIMALEADGADVHSIETYFHAVASKMTISGSPRKGCLMVNSMVELAGENVSAVGLMRKFERRLERAIRNALDGAKISGQLRDGLDIANAARFLITTVSGMAVMSKRGLSRKRLIESTQFALDAITSG